MASMQKTEAHKLTKITNNLKDQVTILNQEVKNLGKRTAIVSVEEAIALDGAIVREIKRRRKDSRGQDPPVTLTERRANDKATVSRIIKDNSNLLVHWNEILARCLEDKEAATFKNLKSVTDFIDGFELKVPSDLTARQLQRLLKECGLDATVPTARQQTGTYWLQLASGP